MVRKATAAADRVRRQIEPAAAAEHDRGQRLVEEPSREHGGAEDPCGTHADGGERGPVDGGGVPPRAPDPVEQGIMRERGGRVRPRAEVVDPEDAAVHRVRPQVTGETWNHHDRDKEWRQCRPATRPMLRLGHHASANSIVAYPTQAITTNRDVQRIRQRPVGRDDNARRRRRHDKRDRSDESPAVCAAYPLQARTTHEVHVGHTADCRMKRG